MSGRDLRWFIHELDKAGEVRRPNGQMAVDEWNERERRVRQGQPLHEVRDEWLESFQKVMQALAIFPPEKLQEEYESGTVRELFAEDTYGHYHDHLTQLSAWRREVGTTEA